MRRETVTSALQAILLGALVYLSCRQVFILEHLRVQQDQQSVPEGALMVRTDSWRYLDSNGVSQPHTVSVTFRDSGHPSETVAEWKQRFEDKVTADEAIYPRIVN